MKTTQARAVDFSWPDDYAPSENECSADQNRERGRLAELHSGRDLQERGDGQKEERAAAVRDEVIEQFLIGRGVPLC